MLRHNITAKEADGHPCVMFMANKVAGKHPGDAPRMFTSHFVGHKHDTRMSISHIGGYIVSLHKK